MTRLTVKIANYYVIKSNNSHHAQKVYEVLSMEGKDNAMKLADKLGVMLEWIDRDDSVSYEEK